MGGCSKRFQIYCAIVLLHSQSFSDFFCKYMVKKNTFLKNATVLCVVRLYGKANLDLLAAFFFI